MGCTELHGVLTWSQASLLEPQVEREFVSSVARPVSFPPFRSSPLSSEPIEEPKGAPRQT